MTRRSSAVAHILAAALLLCGSLSQASTRSLESGSWALISPPLGGASVTAADLFGDAVSAVDYERSWVMYRWATAGGQGAYEVVPLDEPLVPGEGYWAIQVTGADVPLTLADSQVQGVPPPARGCPSIAGCVQVPLDAPDVAAPLTWDLTGIPITSDLPMTQARVVGDGPSCRSGCSLSEAAGAELVGAPLFRYRDGTYEPVNDDATLEPWDGVWAALFAQAAAGQPMLTANAAVPDQRPDLANDYELIFEDEFDGPTLDASKWNTGLLWGPYVVINNEEQLYVDTLGMHADLAGGDRDPFVFTDEGTMKIVASAVEPSRVPPQPAADDDVWGSILEYRHDPAFDVNDANYLSGIINTYEAFKFSHGYAEIRAKIPAGRGLWPAFWMLPTHYVEIIPEIDIMEALGQNPNEVYHTYHFFDRSDGWQARRTPTYETLGPYFSSDFHTYGVAWEPGQLIYYVDGMETRRVRDGDPTTSGDTIRIPQQAMYLIANLAVGGNWPGSPDGETAFPAELEIDWIRAWQKTMTTPVDLSEYELVFGDEFDGGALDETKWNTSFLWGPYLPINCEEQYYVDVFGVDRGKAYSPFDVSGGHLTITAAEVGTLSPANVPEPTPTDGSEPPTRASAIQTCQESDVWTNRPEDYEPEKYTSGLITSYDAFKFVEGYAEIRAHVPAGDGLWPAFWLLNGYYVGQNPEIDVMEIIGENPGRVQHTYHRLAPNGLEIKDEFFSTGGSADDGFADGYHTFAVQWKRGEIHWYVDGVLTASHLDADVPYQLMYVIMNLAVGGNFNTRAVDPAALPAELKIDYVRVYQERPRP